MDPLSNTLRSTDVLDALASPTVAERDDATRVAIATGGALGPRLLKLDGLPLPVRARRLWAYTGIHMRRGEDGLRRARRYDLRHRGTLRSALEILGITHGVPIAADLAAADAPVALELTAATLLAALDAACAQAGCRGTQGVRGELTAQLGAEPRYPVCYSGPLRLRVVEMRVLRSTDFATTSATAQLRLRVDWEWPIEPVSPPMIKLDGLGARAHDATPAGTGSEIVVEIDVPSGPVVVGGLLAALFDGPFDEVALPVPGSIDVHGLAVAAAHDEGGVMLTLQARDAARARHDGGVIGLSPAVLAIAADGEETLPQVQRMRMVGMAGPAVVERWRLRARDGMAAIRELRLRIAAPPVRVSFPISLPPIPMP
jgi:hypothetical protein